MSPQSAVDDEGLLVKELRDRLGDGLRSVAVHDGRSATPVYRRDDLDGEPGTVDPALGASAPRSLPAFEVAGQAASQGPHFLVRPVEDALLVQTPVGTDGGWLVTLDRDAGGVEAVTDSLQKHA